jgi:serine/threonine protein kinase
MDPLAPQFQVALPGVPQVGDVIAEKYRVESMLGVGGMGVVLSARHLKLGQIVAIKVLTVREDQQKDAVERFLREGRAAAGLGSDHVVRIYDVGQLDDGTPFMVMERLHGQDLAAVLTERGPLPVDEAVEYIAQATMAIAEAHEAGVVHRDLKPSNLFLTQRSDGAACIKVLDFGISKQLSMFESNTLRGDLTQTRQVMGSPAYMSPEQVRDARSVDHRTDIWALGTTLYELLTRHVAFDADTLPAVCAAIAADPPTPLEVHRADVPSVVADIVMRCLEKVPTKRYQSARELLSVLRAYQGRPDKLVSSRNGQAPPTAISVNPAVGTGTGNEGVRQIMESGARRVEPASAADGQDSTLLSGQFASSEQASSAARGPGASDAARDKPNGAVNGDLVAPRTVPSRRQRGKRIGYFVFGGLVLVIAVTMASWHLVPSPAPRGAPVSVAPTHVETTAFSLRIESEPPKATVFEGERLLGETPLVLSIERASVASTPRRFTLRKPGYLDAQLVQADSGTDRQIAVTLSGQVPVDVAPVAPKGSNAVGVVESPVVGPVPGGTRTQETKSPSSGLRSRSATSKNRTTLVAPSPLPPAIRSER